MRLVDMPLTPSAGMRATAHRADGPLHAVPVPLHAWPPQVSTVTSANAYQALGVDNRWDFAGFSDQFQIKINHLDELSMEFDVIGIDPAVANALRRILLSEVPTVAIEHVFMVDNTSIIQVRQRPCRLGCTQAPARANALKNTSPYWCCCRAASRALTTRPAVRSRAVLAVRAVCPHRTRCWRTGWAWCPSAWTLPC